MALYRDFKWTRRSFKRNLLTQHFEPLQPHMLRALARHFGCDFFLDVGANIGIYSLFMSDVVDTVLAFEPTPECFRELKRNVSLNEINIQVYPMAASDREGAVDFGVMNGLSGANSIPASSIHSKFRKTIQVPAIRIDNILPATGKTFCAKIDVEGHEPAVLKGMANLLARNRGVLQIETYGQPIEIEGYRPAFNIGPDHYYTNLPLSDGEIADLFQVASRDMVEAQVDIVKHKDRMVVLGPLRVQVGAF